jgi:hypothetical protein
MEIEATTTEIVLPAAGSSIPSALDAAAFGTRPSAGRPHSINLFGAPRDVANTVASRGTDVLLGVGIGAALMYYLDRNHGPQRRSALGSVLEDLALTVIGRVASRARGG